MLKKLCLAGFGGIWIDRNGYADRAASLCKELAALLRVSPMESSNGRWAFFDMAKFNCTCRASFTDEQWPQAQERTLNPILPIWTGGFSFPSGAEPDTLRCCTSRGRLELSNSSHVARKCCLTFTVRTWHPQPAHLVINGLGIATTHLVSSVPRKLVMSCTVPPGLHAITFDCDAAQAPPAEDPRDRVFVVSRFSIDDVD